jgi:hypothetical protein
MNFSKIDKTDIEAARGLLLDAGYPTEDKARSYDAAVELMKVAALQDVSTQLHKLVGISQYLQKIEELAREYSKKSAPED